MKKSLSKICLFLAIGAASVVLTSCPENPVGPDCPCSNNVTDISLNKTTLSLDINASETLVATVTPNNAVDQIVTWASSNAEVAIVANGKVIAVSEGIAVITVKAGDKTDTCTVTVSPILTPTYDPGVTINGVKWATRNVDTPGTFATGSEDYGKIYQWNRITAWSTTEPSAGIPIGSWISALPTGDIWAKENDPSPAGWRIPTRNDIQKLLDKQKVDNEWTVQKGVTGRKFTDKTTGNNVFFPAVGCRYDHDGARKNAGLDGGYWSNMAYEEDFTVTGAYSLNIRNDGASCVKLWRSYGVSVRCVSE